MKHNVKITIVILVMFLIAQFIGLYVVNSYSSQKVVDGQIVNNTGKIFPYGMGFQGEEQNITITESLISLLFSLIIAISLIFILIKIKARFIMRTWFLVVSAIALGISFTAFLPTIKYAPWIALAFAIPLAVGKIYKKSIVTHNLTEILIYPGIAAVFVPIFGILSIIIILIIISIYDMWAVWKSKIMQKMAKFQMEEVNFFGGFLIPYASKKVKEKIRNLKLKFQDEERLQKEFKKSKIKVHLAMLGGGDIVFPIITSGVVLKIWGLFPAILVIVGALLGLMGLLMFSEKKKMYPAMPFITAGMFLGMLVSYLFFII